MCIMADSTLLVTFPSTFPMGPRRSSYPILHSLSPKPPILNLRLHSSSLRLPRLTYHVSNVQEAVGSAITLIQSSPPTWESALATNLLIFLLGSPLLVAGLSLSGIGAAFLLGTLTWRAFGPSGFLIVSAYFIIGTAVTKVKMAQKEAQGIAEKRKGRRGPGSVVGSGAAGCLFALLSIWEFGGEAFSQLWLLGFVASFCTKLSDTVSSEIGKAYGKTTYLVTTFKIVPRGTEGAVSVEGTSAGILASIVLAFLSCLLAFN
ncbi:protein VTE6, chloroplastic-like isoform X2 [Neltuma alba]|uniref:protein VTE6, chloroplastic-like isoform X2 n=1 Tax=Neltuma alba TaxID=207710 RepID=UPI0010A45D4D|nr:protein VTE6, chloroplastic-like isoform X2 [Prosopis alba]